MSSLSVCVSSNLTFFPSMFTSTLSNKTHKNFQSLLLSVRPDSIVKSVNHAVPFASPSAPPSLNPKSILFLFFELKQKVTKVQSDVPVTLSDFWNVFAIHICAPTSEYSFSATTSCVFILHVTLYTVLGVTSIVLKN